MESTKAQDEMGARAIVALDIYTENEWEVFIPEAAAVLTPVLSDIEARLLVLRHEVLDMDPDDPPGPNSESCCSLTVDDALAIVRGET